MKSPRLGRALAVAAGLLSIALLSAGCGVVQSGTGHRAGSSVPPRLGDCWRVTYAGAAQSEDWEGSGAVPCTARHESYTYAVTKLTTKFAGSWLDSKGNPRAAVDTAAFRACLGRENALLPAITPKEALFYPTYYIPSVPQWNDGARWVRCDMTEIKVGSEVAKPRLATLPARFADVVSELKANPEKFALCENDVFNNGPDGGQTTYADCTKPADWTFVLRLTLPGAASTPYPGSAQLKTLGTQKCTVAVQPEAGHDVFAKTPDESAWVRDGARAVDCWINNN